MWLNMVNIVRNACVRSGPVVLENYRDRYVLIFDFRNLIFGFGMR